MVTSGQIVSLTSVDVFVLLDCFWITEARAYRKNNVLVTIQVILKYMNLEMSSKQDVLGKESTHTCTLTNTDISMYVCI